MATVYITEFSAVGSAQIGGEYLQIAAVPPVAEQTVIIGGSNTQSAAFNAATTLIRVETDAICSIKLGGTNPVATAASARFAANQTEYFGVSQGQAHKIGVITNV